MIYNPERDLLEEIGKGESNRLEFKAELPDDHKKFIKTAVAFTNTSGGRILFGVSDDRKIVGIPDDKIYSVKDAITDSIYKSCEPAIIPYVYIMTVSGRNILVAEFQPGEECPYFIKSEGVVKGTYIRASGTSVPARPSILKSLQMRGRGYSFDMMEYPGFDITQSDVDSLCTRLSSFKLPITPASLENMGIIKMSHGRPVATNAFALLTKNPFIYAKIQCARFRDNEGLVFEDSQDITGDVISQIDGAVTFIKKHLNMKSVIDGLIRQDRYEIPIPAIREAVVNAVLHREYSITECSIIIRIFDSHIDIESPGLSLGIDPANPYSGRSAIRNQALASLFKAMGFIEQYGTGIRRIQSECRNNGLDDPLFFEDRDYFIARLYRTPREESHADSATAKEQNNSGTSPADHASNLTETEETILRMISEQTFESIAKSALKLGVSHSTVERALKKLSQKNLVERVGSRKSGQWVKK